MRLEKGEAVIILTVLYFWATNIIKVLYCWDFKCSDYIFINNYEATMHLF